MSYRAQVRKDLIAEGIGAPVTRGGVTRYIFDDRLFPAIQPDELDEVDTEFNTIIYIDGELYQAVGIDWDWVKV